MKEKDSISVIDFIILFIILFYMEYRICIDLFIVNGLNGLNSLYPVYLVISLMFLISLELFYFYNNKHKNRSTNYKEYAKELFIAVIYYGMHVLLLVGFIGSLNYFYLLIIQLVLAFGFIGFTAFINYESGFELNKIFLFIEVYIVFTILASSVTALLLYE